MSSQMPDPKMTKFCTFHLDRISKVSGWGFRQVLSNFYLHISSSVVGIPLKDSAAQATLLVKAILPNPSAFPNGLIDDQLFDVG
jgi:hypothetical protein